VPVEGTRNFRVMAQVLLDWESRFRSPCDLKELGVAKVAKRSRSLGADLPKFAFPADRHMVERHFATRFSGAPVDLAHAGRQ
jgi:hypothetical protein